MCPACSTALCALIRGETREVNLSISERYEPPAPFHDCWNLWTAPSARQMWRYEAVLLREITLISDPRVHQHWTKTKRLLQFEIPHNSNATAFFAFVVYAFIVHRWHKSLDTRTAFGWVPLLTMLLSSVFWPNIAFCNFRYSSQLHWTSTVTQEEVHLRNYEQMAGDAK